MVGALELCQVWGSAMAAPASPPDHKDFWISYNSADRAWAEWVAWQLEAAGYTTVIQAWDFRPGSNFVLEMQRTAESAERTIAILSPDYLQASFPQPEWAAAFAADPTGEFRRLLPIRVRECEPKGLLGPVVYSDFVGLDESAVLRTLLLDVQEGRAKPATPPPFPVITQPSQPAPPFPGNPAIQSSVAPVTVPSGRRARRMRSMQGGAIQLELLPPSAGEGQGEGEPSPDVSSIFGLLASCDIAGSGLPRPVVAAALGMTDATFAPVLARMVAVGQVAEIDGLITLVASEAPVSAVPPEVCARGLDALLGHIAPRRGDGAASAQIGNAFALAQQCIETDPALVAQVFGRLDKLLKDYGRKRLVLDVANLSIQAARREHRGEADVAAEARALICGRAWVYQRIGYLDQAVADAHHSLRLGEDIKDGRNTAFCRKCIGRLYRLQAERMEGESRTRKLEESAESLRGAIDLFCAVCGPDDREVGDCYSLLARTYLVGHHTERAAEALRAAERLLPPDTDKDYVDMVIVKGDLQSRLDDASGALRLYDEALRLTEHGGPLSEVRARAFMGRARHYERARAKRAAADYAAAADIYDGLGEDDAASEARWCQERVEGAIPPEALIYLKPERPTVRMYALLAHRERLGHLKGARTQPRRSDPGEAYWRQLVDKARARAAAQDAAW